MTEKRFTQKDEDDWEILDRNKHFAYAHSGYQAEKIIQELNELVETNRGLYKENMELKSKNRGLQSELQIFKEDATHSNLQINKLADENEQLKEEIKDLNDILARYEERGLKERTNHNEKDCGHCKYLQIDGMFGMWCEKKHNWTEVKYCKDYER